MTAYAIHAWQAVFDTPLTKGARATLSIPLKMGSGYIDLATGPNGAATYGVWISLLRVALDSVSRGTLVYSTREGLKPHDDESLAKLTRFDRKDVASAISRLLEIGWLEEVELPAQKASIPAPDLMDFIEEQGGLRTFRGEDLRDAWFKAVKGLTPSKCRTVFRASNIGISKPWEFIAIRKEQGL